MSGDHTFREVGVLFGGSWWLEMHDDMKVLYSPISCLHVFSFLFHLLVLKFLCLQFANVGRHSQRRWHCYLAESLLHPSCFSTSRWLPLRASGTCFPWWWRMLRAPWPLSCRRIAMVEEAATSKIFVSTLFAHSL